MRQMLVFTFDDKDGAVKSRDRLFEIRKEELIHIADACVMSRNKKGKPKFKQANDLVKTGALGGAFWGALIGLLFLMPFAGMAIGAVIGALTGRMGDIGPSDEFMKEVSESVGPNDSALFLLVDSWNEERVMQELDEFDPRLIKTNLTESEEERLKEAFGAADIEA